MANYTQYVICFTRGDAVLDLLYCNVYLVKSLPQLSDSDHKMLHFIPSYKQKIKKFKPLKKAVFHWSPHFYLKIQACFEITDWSVLFDNSMDVDFNVSVFTEYFYCRFLY